MSGFSRGIAKLVSSDATVTITDPTGPTADLHAAAGITDITSTDGSVTITNPTGPTTNLSVSVTGGGITVLTGDGTTPTGGGSQPLTLVATANVESIISANTTVAGALQQTGGAMSGAIAMGTQKITGLGNGSGAQDAAAFGQIPPASVAATAREVAIATGGTNVVTYTPGAVGNFLIAIYFRVITATTNVTITVTWTDATGAQTLTVLSAVAETTGSYTLTSFMVDSVASSAITVAMTAGTVSQVLGSASILQA